MIGGGGRRTGAGDRRFSVEKDRNTLRCLLAGDVTGDGGVCTFVMAAAAEFSVTAADDGDDGDVKLAAPSSCPLFDVINF